MLVSSGTASVFGCVWGCVWLCLGLCLLGLGCVWLRLGCVYCSTWAGQLCLAGDQPLPAESKHSHPRLVFRTQLVVFGTHVMCLLVFGCVSLCLPCVCLCLSCVCLCLVLAPRYVCLCSVFFVFKTQRGLHCELCLLCLALCLELCSECV